MILYNAARDPQTQTCAYVLFRRVKWLKNFFQVFWLDTASRIGNRYANACSTGVVPGRTGRNFDGECSVLANRVNSVRNKIRKYLAQFPAKPVI